MSVVIDASIALAWCFEDEANAQADAVLDHLADNDAVVPGIWLLEIANVLLLAEKTKRLTEADTAHFLNDLLALPIEVESLDLTMVFGSVIPMGRRYKTTAYDSAYLDCAARHGLPLATDDISMIKAARLAGIPIFSS